MKMNYQKLLKEGLYLQEGGRLINLTDKTNKASSSGIRKIL